MMDITISISPDMLRGLHTFANDRASACCITAERKPKDQDFQKYWYDKADAYLDLANQLGDQLSKTIQT